jgi:para-nitrobenzyl esterase
MAMNSSSPRPLIKQPMITRRIVTQGLAGAGIALLTGVGSATDDAGSAYWPIARTTAGAVQGMTQGEILAFLGIPYGAPTGGSSRFMPPREPTPWTGVRAARAYGDSCPQVPLGLSPFARKRAPAEAPPAPTAMQKQLAALFGRQLQEQRQSEECLVLNVWTRALDSAKRPVMVWLHGGGFAVGSGSAAAYNGGALAKRGDVVVVTINHRLNVFGHLYLGEIAGDAFASSGNVGMLDVVQALQWVRDNIKLFGGDPGNVTIFGESGGAGKVSVVCAMPAAKGLFHKAIMQSGPCLRIADTARGAAIARQLLADLGLTSRDVGQLQQMDAMKLTAAADAAEVKVVPRVLGYGPMGMIPLVDGIVLPHQPFESVAAPESAKIPFLAGSTKDEAVLFAGALPGWEQFTDLDLSRMMQPIAAARSRQAIDLYQRLHPSDSAPYLLIDVVTDFWMRQAANRVAELKVKQASAPAYVYVLEWEINPELRCPHGTDVALVFDNIAASPAIAAAPDAQSVSDRLSAAWIAFARSGNPNTSGNPHWPAYSLRSRPNMLFNVTSRVVDDYDGQAREFWEEA